MQQLADSSTTVRISHHYAASPARVFDAWLTPQLAGLWLFATASRPMVNVVIDARVGGTFCFVERRAGTLIEHRGHYVEITRPQRLVLMLRSPDCARVTAEFTPSDTGCELRLVHDGLFADDATPAKGTSFPPRGLASQRPPGGLASQRAARWEGMLYGLGVVLAQHNAK